MTFWLLLTTVLATGDANSAIGTIQVGRGVSEPMVWLIVKAEGASLRVEGELTRELSRLQSSTVELLGARSPQHFVVEGYRIVALPGGAKPLAVGLLVEAGSAGNIGISTDDGRPLPLNAAPRLRTQLSGLIGAKVWIVGDKLLSGEIKVRQFGLLRERPTPPTPTKEASPQVPARW